MRDMQKCVALSLPPGDDSRLRPCLRSEIAAICFLAFILHEVKRPDSLVAEISRLLKPEGRALIVEWKADLDSPGPPRKIRLTREYVESLFKRNGFCYFDYLDWSKNYYVATVSKTNL